MAVPNWTADCAPPEFLAGCRIEGLDDIVLGRSEQHAGVRARWTPIERLRVEGTGHTGVKHAIEVHRPGFLPGQRRNDKIAASTVVTMVCQNRVLFGDGRDWRDCECKRSRHQSNTCSHRNRRLRSLWRLTTQRCRGYLSKILNKPSIPNLPDVVW